MNSKNHSTIIKKFTSAISIIVFLLYAIWLIGNESTNAFPNIFSLFTVVGICTLINKSAKPLEDAFLISPDFEFSKTFLPDDSEIKKLIYVGAGSFIWYTFISVLMLIIVKTSQPLSTLTVGLENLFGAYTEVPKFLHIATNWYSNIENFSDYKNVLPIFPIILKVISLGKANIYIAIILNIILASLSSVLLYLIAVFDYDESTSLRSVVYMSIFPTSFFLVIPLSFSLFLCLSLLFILLIRKRKWFASFITGYILGFVHPFAITLLFYGIVEFITMIREDFVLEKYGLDIDLENSVLDYVGKERSYEDYLPYIYKGLSLLGIPFSLLIYTVVSKITYTGKGSFLLFLKDIPNIFEHLFFANAFELVFDFFSKDVFGLKIMWGSYLPVAFSIFFVIVFFLFTFYTKIKLTIRASYLVYIISMFIIIFSSTEYIRSPKYLLLMFPIFLISADYSSESILGIILSVLFFVGFVAYYTFFLLGFPVY